MGRFYLKVHEFDYSDNFRDLNLTHICKKSKGMTTVNDIRTLLKEKMFKIMAILKKT